MKTYIVQLDNHDDVISARDKISWSKARRVLLVWPRRGKVLERRMDLLLLQRHARRLGAQLAIVTNSSVAKEHARDLGIYIFSSAEEAQQIAWRRPKRRRRIFQPMSRPQDPHALRQQRGAFHPPAAQKIGPRLAAFTCGILAVLSMLGVFLPRAEIAIQPVRVPQEIVLSVWASPEISAANPGGGLPAQTLSAVVEGRDQAASTGQVRIPDQPAGGVVQLTNLTDTAVDIPAGAVVITLAHPPVRYLTTTSRRVPAGPAQVVSVPVQAESAGSAGNQPAGAIRAMEGPLGLRVAVNNNEPLRGGTDRVSPAPSLADGLKLRENLLARLQETALSEIQSRVKTGERLLTETLSLHQVLEETQEPARGAPGDRLQLGMRVEYQALVVNEQDLQAVAQAALDANQKNGYRPVAGSLRIIFMDEPRDVGATAGAGGPASENSVRWNIRAERSLEPVWSQTNLVQAIQGRGIEEARAILQANLPMSAPPLVRVEPSWWARIPLLPFRVQLVTQ